MSIQETFVNALLADAAYADDLDDGLKGDTLRAALSKRMTPPLAEFIADNFEIASHIEGDDFFGSGFDATVWRGRVDTPYAGKVYVSMQGTKGLGDFLADINLSLNGNAGHQVIDMTNWWERITTPVGGNATQWAYVPDSETGVWGLIPYTAPGTGLLSAAELASGGVEVNGHSLGGYLAAAFTRLFGSHAHVQHTTTFNSAGFAPGSEAAFAALASAVGHGNGRPFPGPGSAAQTNVFAAKGINVTTNTFYFEQQGSSAMLT